MAIGNGCVPAHCQGARAQYIYITFAQACQLDREPSLGWDYDWLRQHNVSESLASFPDLHATLQKLVTKRQELIAGEASVLFLTNRVRCTLAHNTHYHILHSTSILQLQIYDTCT